MSWCVAWMMLPRAWQLACLHRATPNPCLISALGSFTKEMRHVHQVWAPIFACFLSVTAACCVAAVWQIHTKPCDGSAWRLLRLSDRKGTILAAKELFLLAQTLLTCLINR